MLRRDGHRLQRLRTAVRHPDRGPVRPGHAAGTYTQQLTYAPSGQELSYTDSAAGGLPAETVTTGYDSAGEPSSLSGAGSYVNSLSYTSLGQPLQYKMGTSTEPAYITDAYDPQTGRVSEQNTQTGSANTSVLRRRRRKAARRRTGIPTVTAAPAT